MAHLFTHFPHALDIPLTANDVCHHMVLYDQETIRNHMNFTSRLRAKINHFLTYFLTS